MLLFLWDIVKICWELAWDEIRGLVMMMMNRRRKEETILGYGFLEQGLASI
jgi:hypothetical protein